MKCPVCNGLGLKPFRPYLEFHKRLYTEDECIECFGHGIVSTEARDYTVVFSVEGKEDSIEVRAESAGEALFVACRAIGPVVDRFMGAGELLKVEVIA